MSRPTHRFDRPSDPHDWRWALGIVGRALISFGLLLFAFVAYQLWGTGIQTAREQNRLRNEFDALLETTMSVPMAAPSDTSESRSAPSITPVEVDEPAATTTTTSMVSVPALVIPHPAEGDPVARLESAAMGVSDQIVVEGVSPIDLQDGPGHFPETPLPGQLGSAAIAGHRTTHGQPFCNIDRLKPGDDVIVSTLAGRYVYLVTGQVIVDPSEYAKVIPTVEPMKATLTLTSCDPPFSAKRRMVVFAELDVERSSPISSPSNVEEQASQPTVPPVQVVPPASSGARSTATQPTTTVAMTSGPAPTVPRASVDLSDHGREAFENGGSVILTPSFRWHSGASC